MAHKLTEAEGISVFRMLGHPEDEYEIYVRCVAGTGEEIKTFDEWLNS